MADRIKVSQIIAQTEWQNPPKVKVSQIIAQVEYVTGAEGGGLFFANG
jgi:hypothetical protein